MRKNIVLSLVTATILLVDHLDRDALAQSTKQQLAEIKEAILIIKNKQDDLETATKAKIKGLDDKAEASQILSREAIGLLTDLMEATETIRKEQATQLEELLELRISLPILRDQVSTMTERTSKLEGIVLDSERLDRDLSDRLERIEARLSSGFFTRSLRDQEALRAELATIRGTVEEMDLAQEKFASRLRRFYDDLDFRIRQLVIEPLNTQFNDTAEEDQPARIDPTSETVVPANSRTPTEEASTVLDQEDVQYSVDSPKSDESTKVYDQLPN